MTQTPPFRNRPKFHLPLAQSTESLGYLTQSAPVTSSFSTPLSITTYSPFRSAGLIPPTPYGTRTQRGSLESKCYGKKHYYWFWVRRILSSKTIWLMLMLGALMLWWVNGGRDELDLVKLGATELGKELFQEERIRDLQFFPATNPKIHYVGRWTATPNRLRRDGTFPGVYFDVSVTNTTTLFLSLHNAAGISSVSSPTSSIVRTPNTIHVPFRPISTKEKPSPPVSLLAQVDQEEYILLPNASALVPICSSNLNQAEEHQIRIVAPMTDEHGQGVVEFEGLWISKGGKLLRVEGSLLGEEYESEDSFDAENEQVGEKHRIGLSELSKNTHHTENRSEVEHKDAFGSANQPRRRKKVIEIVTDSPGSFGGKHKSARTGGADGLLAGVMGWEYLIGDMFGADHIGIGVEGMCLTQECIGGIGSPAGIGEVFFRSGPYGSERFDHPWMFDAYVPDVIVINIGESDARSFELYGSEYNKSAWEFSERFENTYMSLIKAIRSLAYPQSPSAVNSQRSGHSAYVSNTSPASIPILIMRPFRGQLEHTTQNVVARLRADGDKGVFWLDTSGWLEEEEDSINPGDFFHDKTTKPPRWRLTVQGNQRVAIFLHAHVCRYLAIEEEKCAFLPHEDYQGKVFDPTEDSFAHYLENEKEVKLKELFWDGEEGDGGETHSS